MGVLSLKPTRLLLFLTLSLITHSSSADDSRETPPPNPNDHVTGVDDIATGKTTRPPPPPLSPPPQPSWETNDKKNFTSFRPSVAVIVGVITTTFSVVFLFLLYARHCKRGNVVVFADYNRNSHLRGGGGGGASSARKNSGIDRSVIESLPIFRFGSLTGQKDGLECAVCLNKFEPAEVLRLLPKCKHAFHVECVDTWLDAHSTCPLCRYRVDPEDVLLVDDARILHQNQPIPPLPPPRHGEDFTGIETGLGRESCNRAESDAGYRRVSGRHSSAGEKGSGLLQISMLTRNNGNGNGETGYQSAMTSLRRSLDSAGLGRKKGESVSAGVGCFDRPRKDGLLLTEDKHTSLSLLEQRRLEHRIIVSPASSGFHQRWSDLQPSDLLYLRSEMIISDSHRLSSGSGSRPSVSSRQQRGGDQDDSSSGRGVINSRSMSEITGLSRFSNRDNNDKNSYNKNNVIINVNDLNSSTSRQHQERQRQAGVVSRWLAWISQNRAQPAVR